MRKTLKEIAGLINGEVVGDSGVVIQGFSGIKEAQEGDITFLANPKYLPFIDTTKASAVITSRDILSASKPIIRTDNPSEAFTRVVSLCLPEAVSHLAGIDKTAVIAKNVLLGKDVSIGPLAVIGENAVIGDKTVIYAGCYIGRDTTIGRDTLLYPNVTVRERVSIGDRVIIHSGTVIGSDGFGFITVGNTHHKIPQLGTVIIEDDVEIGANCAVDRARFDKTVIGKGSKLDNLVHLAHNVIIGKNCLLVAQVGVSGSTTLGDNVVLAGQVGLVGHITLGNNVVVMAQSGVSKSIPDNAIVWGCPAKPQAAAKRVNACVQNLPRLYEKIDALKKKVEELEAKLQNK